MGGEELALTVSPAMAAALRRGLLRLPQIMNSSITANQALNPLFQKFPATIYRSLHGSVSYFSSEHGSLSIDLSGEESRRRLFNRLLYRSKQRGFIELDLILGKWVEENIHSMDETQIKALVDVLDLENLDLWKWLTGQEQPPEAVTTNLVFLAVRAQVLSNLNSHAAPETRATLGRPWVRGWDDKRGQEGPIYGNQ